MADEIPKKLGKYEVTRVLGKGAMGIVYEGNDPVIERRVAIKTVHKALLEGDGGQELLARFKREAQAAGRLMHQNIVAVYEYGEEQGTPFIAMEFIEGKELKDYIKEQARFEVSQVVDIMEQTLSAMDYVHAGGVVHRDMKPANIILLDNGQVKVADFGIARVESSTMTQMGAVMGTPSYMSPEQFMGQRVDQRADLFSIGVILYELLTSEKPFPGKAVATIMQKVLNAPVEDPTTYNFDLPNAFNTVIKKALAKRPGDRFQSAKEFMEAIKLAAEDKYADSLRPPAPAAMDDEATVMAGSMGADEATVLAAPAAIDAGEATHTAPPQMTTAPQAAPAPAAARVAAGTGDKKSAMPLIAAGVAGLLLVGGGGWWFTQKPSEPIPSPTTPAATRTTPAVEPPAPTTPAVEALPTATPPSAVAKGEINAISDPVGAVILVDGEFMGVTPHRFALAAGEYQLSMRKDGYHTLEASLEVEANGVLDLDVTLDPK